MDRTDENLHYHIRWSGIAALDWECFSTRAEAEATARQLVRQEETFSVEERDETCPRCREAMELKMTYGSSKSAAA